MEGVGITNPPVLIGRTFFDGGFQIRRNAWRTCVLENKIANPPERLAGLRSRKKKKSWERPGGRTGRKNADSS